MKSLFSRLALISLLIFSANSTVGQTYDPNGYGIYVDGVLQKMITNRYDVVQEVVSHGYANLGNIETLEAYPADSGFVIKLGEGKYLYNAIHYADVSNFGHIGTIIALRGTAGNEYHSPSLATLENEGSVGTAHVFRNGRIVNGNGYYGNSMFLPSELTSGTIDTVNLYETGELSNYNESTVGTVNMYGISVVRNYDNAVIDTINVDSSGGTIYNGLDSGAYSPNIGSNATIGTINVNVSSSLGNDVNLWNSNNGTIGTVNLLAGVLYNNVNSAVNTSNIFEGVLMNFGNIETTNVSGGTLDNGYLLPGGLVSGITGTIGTVNLSGGTLRNNFGSTINTANVTGGTLGSGHGIIGTANISGGTLRNSAGIVDTANVSGGELYHQDGATLNQANVSGGMLYNHLNNSIGAVSISGGRLENHGSVDTVTLSDSGLVNNHSYRTIGNLTMNGGTVTNYSYARIEEMTYTNGEYVAARISWHDPNTGTIGTLTLAGNSANNTGDWGQVDNLKFDSNGGGILTISAFVVPEASSFGIQAMSASFAPNISFSGINAQNVDLTNGRVVLDMAGYEMDLLNSLFADNVIDLSTLFGTSADAITGVEGLNSLEIAFRDTLFPVYSNRGFTEGWSFTGYNAATPEPATLAILGLGLAGLGLARRRR